MIYQISSPDTFYLPFLLFSTDHSYASKYAICNIPFFVMVVLTALPYSTNCPNSEMAKLCDLPTELLYHILANFYRICDIHSTIQALCTAGIELDWRYFVRGVQDVAIPRRLRKGLYAYYLACRLCRRHLLAGQQFSHPMDTVAAAVLTTSLRNIDDFQVNYDLSRWSSIRTLLRMEHMLEGMHLLVFCRSYGGHRYGFAKIPLYRLSVLPGAIDENSWRFSSSHIGRASVHKHTWPFEAFVVGADAYSNSIAQNLSTSYDITHGAGVRSAGGGAYYDIWDFITASLGKGDIPEPSRVDTAAEFIRHFQHHYPMIERANTTIIPIDSFWVARPGLQSPWRREPEAACAEPFDTITNSKSSSLFERTQRRGFSRYLLFSGLVLYSMRHIVRSVPGLGFVPNYIHWQRPTIFYNHVGFGRPAYGMDWEAGYDMLKVLRIAPTECPALTFVRLARICDRPGSYFDQQRVLLTARWTSIHNNWGCVLGLLYQPALPASRRVTI